MNIKFRDSEKNAVKRFERIINAINLNTEYKLRKPTKRPLRHTSYYSNNLNISLQLKKIKSKTWEFSLSYLRVNIHPNIVSGLENCCGEI